MLKEYAELLSFPISRIINLSLKEQSLPKIWKFADVSPLPKVKQVEDPKKQLRPISLTPCLSKVTEECVVLDYAKPAVLDVRDLSQYGAVPNSSTTQELTHMLHNWSKETDVKCSTVRAILFEYKKAFDLIGHRILHRNWAGRLCPQELSIGSWTSFLIVPKESNHLRAVTPSGIQCPPGSFREQN